MQTAWVARTTILDAAVKAKILAASRRGMSRARAAQCAGVGVSTYKLWVQRANAGDEPYASFLAEVKDAEADAERRLLALIRGHAVETWQAAAWLLERRYPKRYALRQRVTHEVQLTEEQARAKYRELTGKEWGE